MGGVEIVHVFVLVHVGRERGQANLISYTNFRLFPLVGFITKTRIFVHVSFSFIGGWEEVGQISIRSRFRSRS